MYRFPLIYKILNNVINGFQSNNKGFSIKKQISALSVTILLLITWLHINKHPESYEMALGLWLTFVASALGISAIEKKNELKKNNQDEQK